MGTTVFENVSTLRRSLASHVHRGGLEVVDELRDDWLNLCKHSTRDAPSNRPEYFAAYVKAFEPQSPIVLVSARLENTLVGILPLVEAKEVWYGLPVHLLTTPRGDHYGWFDVITREGFDPNLICEALLSEVTRLDGWDALRLRQVPEGSAAYKMLQAGSAVGLLSHSIETNQVPYIAIDPSKGDFDSFLNTRSGKFRYMLRRTARRAAESGGLSIRRFENADPAALQEFYRVEASGWKGEAGTAINCEPHVLQFYNETARAAADQGHFRLYLMDFNFRPIAGVFGFELNGTFSIPKVGYDEHFKQLAPGHLLVSAVLRECWARGLREFDFLGAPMPWKSDWTSTSRASWKIHLYRNNLTGRVLEKVRFGVMPVARSLYRRARSTKSKDEK
jgi:CelD/BcsL family acetyltransferase involved in cellulose biosynthesis